MPGATLATPTTTAPHSRTSDSDFVLPRNRWRVFGIAFVVCLAAMMLWNLASPLASVPDEPTHFIRAASVVRGQIFAPPLPSKPSESEAIVPNWVAYSGALTCFAFLPDKSAGCARPIVGDPNSPIVVGQTAETNNPAFYAIVGLPSLLMSGNAGLYAMRSVNAVLCSLMVAFIFMCVAQLRRPRWAYLAAFVSVTPMVLYLGGSVNPNALEATAAGALFAALAVVLSRPFTTRLLVERLAMVVISTAMLVSTRSISLLWVLLALAAAFLMSDTAVLKRLRSQPLTWVAVGLAGAFSLLSLIWFIRPPGTTAGPPYSGAGTSFLVGFAYMLTNTFDFGMGWIGYFGWVDTPAPAITLVAYSSAMVAIVLAAVSVGRRRRLWSVLLLIVAAFLVPAISQAAIVTSVGYIWQGRYTLAIIVMLIIACGFVLDTAGLRAPARPLRVATVILVAFLGVAQLAAFANTLKRYVIGANASLQYMITQPGWQPPLKWETLCALFVVVLVATCILVSRAVIRPHPDEPAQADRDDAPRVRTVVPGVS